MLYLWKIFHKKTFQRHKLSWVRDHCHNTGKYWDAAHSICDLKFNLPNEIPVVFHNGSKYDYHFIIKELESEFEGSFECIEENREIYKIFSVPIKKEALNINKDGSKSVETMSYKIKFIDSSRFMVTSLSKLVNNLAEGIHKIKCWGCDCFLEYERANNNLLKYKCLSRNKDHSRKLDEKFKKRFKNSFKLPNNDINKFFLLLRKGIYLCQYMDSWQRFDKKSLPDKKPFYSELYKKILVMKTISMLKNVN